MARSSYSLADHQEVHDAVMQHKALNPDKGLMACARDCGYSYGRFTYAVNVLRAKGTLGDEAERPSAAQPDDAGALPEDGEEPAEPGEVAADEVVRVVVVQGTVAAVARFMREWEQ